jgi:hypothetical protein
MNDNPLTDDELDALAALLERATPGPWSVMREYSNRFAYPVTTASGEESEQNWEPYHHYSNADTDAALIAALRNAAPALLRQVREQAAEIERLRAENERWLDAYATNETILPDGSLGVELRDLLKEREQMQEEIKCLKKNGG